MAETVNLSGRSGLKWIKKNGYTYGILLFAVLFGNFFLKITYPGFINPNMLSRVYLAMAIAEDGSFHIDNVVNKYGDIQDMAEYKGHLFSDKPPGYSILLSPVAWLIKIFLPSNATIYTRVEIFRLFGVTVPTVFFWLVCYSILTGFGLRPHLVFASILIGAFGTVFFIYSNKLFSHAPAGILLFMSMISMFPSLYPPLRKVPPALIAFSSGFFLLLALSFDYILLLAVCCIGFTAVLRLIHDWKTLIPFLLGCVIPLAGVLLYNKMCFDSPFRTGFHLHADPYYGGCYRSGFFGIQVPLLSSIPGMLIFPQRGLLFFSPVLLFSIAGFREMLRNEKFRQFGLLSLVATGAVVVFSMTTVDWKGGWSAATRYLVPVIPVLVGSLAIFLQTNQRSSLLLRCMAGFALVGFFHAGIALLTFSDFPDIFINPLYNFCLPLLRSGCSTASQLKTPPVVTVAIWSAFMAGIALLFLLNLFKVLEGKQLIKSIVYSCCIAFCFTTFSLYIKEPDSLKEKQAELLDLVIHSTGFGIGHK
ncbi:MAG: hypothetical protein JW863_05910 [Chitinispirillaceae bacterium]|nr:hypothetical protein [Chitinispirillaceae bacterium]